MNSNKVYFHVINLVLGMLWWVGAILVMNSPGVLPTTLGFIVVSCICIPPIVGAILMYYTSGKADKLTRVVSVFLFPFLALPIFGILGLIDAKKTSGPRAISRTKEQCPFFKQGYCATPNTPTSQRLLCSLQYGSYDRDCAVYPVNLSKM